MLHPLNIQKLHSCTVIYLGNKVIVDIRLLGLGSQVSDT